MNPLIKVPPKTVEDLSKLSLEELTWLHDHNRKVHRLITKNYENPRIDEFLRRTHADLTKVFPFNKYDRNILIEILKQVGAIQLENKCMGGCTFCGFTHNKRFGQNRNKQIHLPVEVLRSLFKLLQGGEDNPVVLYYESDPYEYEMAMFEGSDQPYFYPDIDDLFSTIKNLGEIQVTTSVPRGREELVVESVIRGYVSRISVSVDNRKRLEDKGVIERVSAINTVRRIAEGHGVYESEKLDIPNLSRILNIEFDPKENQREFSKRVIRLLGIKINGRRADLHYVELKQMGKLFGDDRYEVRGNEIGYTTGIGFFNGTLVTPYGIFNVVQTNLNRDLPDAEELIPIPSDFKGLSFPDSGSIEEILSQGIVQFKMRGLGEGIMHHDFEIANPSTKEKARYIIDSKKVRKI